MLDTRKTIGQLLSIPSHRRRRWSDRWRYPAVSTWRMTRSTVTFPLAVLATAHWPALVSHPMRMTGWVGLSGWLHTRTVCQRERSPISVYYYESAWITTLIYAQLRYHGPHR